MIKEGKTSNASPGVIHILGRIDNKLEKIQDKQIEHGETLVRNTVTLEEHIRRTELLEAKMEHVESEVGGLKSHIAKINMFFQLLKPTKYKVKMLLIISSILGSLYGGHELATNVNSRQTTIEIMQKILK